jgi:outer membrane protein
MTVSTRFWLLGALLVVVGAGRAQDRRVVVEPPQAAGWRGPLATRYSPSQVPPVGFRNSGRAGELIRAGQLYLSLEDAVALALENNLDIELQRYGLVMAEAELRRAQGGGALRGIPLSVRELPAGVGGPGAPLLTSIGTYNPAGAASANIGELGGISQQETSYSITAPFSSGPRVPTYDPALTGSLNWLHQSTPQPTATTTGTQFGESEAASGTFGMEQGFASGASLNFGYTSARQSGNWTKADYNPYTTATAGVIFTQPLLQGFGSAVNQRYVRIARNNQRISDALFRQQVIATVSSVTRLYWDLVSLNQDVRVKREALRLSARLLENNRIQVEAGTLAPIEVKRAQAEVARSRQDLTNSESLLLQQELIVKNVLTRNGGRDPLIAPARVVPLSQIEVPAEDAVEPVQDMLNQASQSRPDLEQARLQIDSARISLSGSRNAMLPQLDLIGSLQNNALSGQANPLLPSGTTARWSDPFFVGGAGNLLTQMLARNFPNYGVGVQLRIPLRNRVAQADMIRDELQVRQGQVRLQQLENQMRLEIESARIALSRARAAYEAAVETRQLQQEALEAEQQRYEVGASTSFFVIQYQRDLVQAQTTEVIARGSYAKSRAALDRALGRTLEVNHIQIEEAVRGRVSEPPHPLP